MSPRMGQMLLDRVRPILRAAIARGAVRPCGSEDLQELEQDGLAQAACMLESAELAGKTVAANSVAFFVLQALRSGRRHGCCSRTDAMSPAAELDGNVVLRSMDESLGPDDDYPDHEITLHDCLQSSGEDPASQGSRELDWDLAFETLNSTDREILCATAFGIPGTELGLSFNVSPARVCQRKREIGVKMRECLGDTVLADCVRESAWEGHMRAYKERRACRYAQPKKQKVKK